MRWSRLLTKLVVRRRRDVGEEPFDTGEQLVEDAVVDRLGNPPGRLLVEAIAEHRPVVVEKADESAHDAVEHPLVMAALHRHIDCLAEQRCHLGPRQALLHRRSERLLNIAVVEHLDDTAEGVGGGLGGALGVGRLGQPPTEALGDARRREPLADDVGREEVALHEVAEAAADVVLAARDDRRVGDRDAERVAEQGGDGEPVGEGADHRRLRCRLEVADPGRLLLERPSEHEHDGGEHQQPRGEQLHPSQIAGALDVGRRQRMHRRDATGGPSPIWGRSVSPRVLGAIRASP